jgi:hypothetical protein
MTLRYVEISQKGVKFLDFTSLTVEEFEQLVPAFEKNYQERMKNLRLDGKPRIGREYQTYSNCPLPTPEDRLLFILVYLKTNNLQVVQGELFGMPLAHQPTSGFTPYCPFYKQPCVVLETPRLVPWKSWLSA